MQDDSDLNFLAKTFEIENSLNGFVESSMCLHNVIVTNGIVRVNGYPEHAIGVSDLSESPRKFLIAKSPAVGEKIDRRARQLQFRVPNKID